MLSRLMSTHLCGTTSRVFTRNIIPTATCSTLMKKNLQTSPPRQKDVVDGMLGAFSKLSPIARKTLDEAGKFGECPPLMKSFLVAGCIPFVAMPASMVFSLSFVPSLAFSQVAYGAAILSFLAGERFGYAVANQRDQPIDYTTIAHVTIPPVIAWLGVLLSPVTGLFSVIGGHMFVVYSDRELQAYPEWFSPVRAMGSVVAISSMLFTIILAILLPKEKSQKH